jgi:hypothetical protein
MKPSICPDPKKVTAEWLTDVMRFAGFDCQVDSFSSEGTGTGQVGQNVRFSLNYRSGVGPETVVGKFASDDPVSRQTGIELNNYYREVRFYQELGHTVDVQTPVALFTDVNPDNHDFVLIMEDLAPGQQGDQIQGCSADDAALALAELAKLQGPRWGDGELRKIEWLTTASAESAAMYDQMWKMFWPGYLERYQSRLSEAQIDLGQRLGSCFELYSQPYQGPLTVTHGDYRLDNMLFGGPYPLAVVDWQSPGLGPGLGDASYFLGTSMQPVERRDHERHLIKDYHEALVAYGVTDYDLDRCWRDYRYYSFGGLIMAVIASMIVGQSERGDDMFEVMATRSAQQVFDLEADEFLA